jgi:hypothetical protein
MARAGKDITRKNTLVEGRAMCDAVKQYGRVWQTGSWQRSVGDFRFACELVLNGRIGKIHTVEVGLPSGTTDFAGTKGQETFGAPPPWLDYETWLGPAPWAPYCPARVHANWRWNLIAAAVDGLDRASLRYRHWGMGMDYGGPTEIEGVGTSERWHGIRDEIYADGQHPNDITMIIAGGYNEIRSGTNGSAAMAGCGSLD